MKRTVPLIAIMLTALNAVAATEPAKPAAVATAAAPLPEASAAPLRLAPDKPLPKELTQLTIIDREIGDTSSRKSVSGSPILVHYTGWIYDPSKPDGKGIQFDSSRTRVAPFSFIIGVGRVIKGWDQGLIGMHIKGQRTLIIPASLAYGERPRPNIPPNSNLMFDVELINIVPRSDEGQTGATSTILPSQPTAPAPAPVPAAQVFLDAKAPLPATTTDLILIDTSVGSGKAAEAGMPVSVHYTGWLYDAKQPGGKGAKFDSSVDRNQPFVFPLGGKRVIRGWDEGVAGMKVGGKRTLIIPPQFGYGERGAGGVIPPNATLIFEVQLIAVNP
jgi:peptidylprolyl isomerase